MIIIKKIEFPDKADMPKFDDYYSLRPRLQDEADEALYMIGQEFEDINDAISEFVSNENAEISDFEHIGKRILEGFHLCDLFIKIYPNVSISPENTLSILDVLSTFNRIAMSFPVVYMKAKNDFKNGNTLLHIDLNDEDEGDEAGHPNKIVRAEIKTFLRLFKRELKKYIGIFSSIYRYVSR